MTCDSIMKPYSYNVQMVIWGLAEMKTIESDL